LESKVEIKANKEWTNFSVIGNHTDVQQAIPVETLDPKDRVSVSFKQLELNILGGSVSVHGHLKWQPEPVLDLSIHGENIDPGVLFSDRPGVLGFQSRLQGRISDETIQVNLNDLRIHGRLLDQPFESSGMLTFQDNQPKLVDLDIHSGKNQLKLSGASDKEFNLQFELEVLEPEHLWPGFGGHWRGKGSVEPIGSSPAAVLVLEGKDIAYGNFNIENYYGSFACDSIDTWKCSAQVELTNLAVDGEVFPSLLLDWNGNLKNHRVGASLVAPSARVNLEFAGECYSDTWNFNIDKASLYIR
jgi:autotransporter translocation and assembly factor TamB